MLIHYHIPLYYMVTCRLAGVSVSTGSLLHNTAVGHVDCACLHNDHRMADSLTETALRSRRYKELCSLLAVSLSEADVQCSSLLSALTPDGDAPLAHPAERLEALIKFSATLDKQKQDVAELLACGKYLVEMLDILECSDTPKAHEVRHKIDDAARQLENVVNAIETKRSELAVEVVHFAETEADIKNIVNWLEAADAQRWSSSRLRLHEKDLSQQVEIERCQQDDAAKWQKHTDQVIAKCRQLRMEPTNYAGMSAQCNSVVASMTERTEHLEAVLQRLLSLQENVDCIKCWMSDAASSLTSKLTLVDSCAEQQTFVENFSNQWRIKRQEFADLLESAEKLGSSEFSLDRRPLQQLLTDVERDWCQLSKSFVNYVSAQVHSIPSNLSPFYSFISINHHSVIL